MKISLNDSDERFILLQDHSKSDKSWLNYGFKVLGGLDYLRNEKLNFLLD